MKQHRLQLFAPVLLGLITLLTAPLGSLRAAPLVAPGAEWQQLGVTALEFDILEAPPGCFDSGHPNSILFNGERGGTLYYDWQQDQVSADGNISTVGSNSFDICGPDGFLFKRATGGTALRFSRDDPNGRSVAHMPTHIAQDGSRIVYSFESAQPYSGELAGKLWASTDGGLTWAERGAQFAGQITYVTVAQADARAIYIVVADHPEAQREQVPFSVYFSPDAGASWERRYGATTGTGDFSYFKGLGVHLLAIPGSGTPRDGLILSIRHCTFNCYAADALVQTSFDGGRSYDEPVEQASPIYYGPPYTIVHTGEGYLRWSLHVVGGDPRKPETTRIKYTLELSTDNGQTWQAMTVPEGLSGTQPRYQGLGQVMVAPGAQGGVFIAAGGYAFYSPDGGRHWQALGGLGRGDLYGITPYLPLSAIWRDSDGQLYQRAIPNAGAGNAARAQAGGVSGSTYFQQTGHNLYRMFTSYWNNNGGLAQFGYPISEPFREVSADGKAYVVQYFQRNKFEYHAENPAPYDVLLGRLGSDAAVPLKQAGHGAFKHFNDMHYEQATYFPQTGHNLRNSFLDYWQAHGGLAIYGYPISEEFEQQSATDGKTYIVQYFERNRFEYHPENKGTANEVLLGLLGSDALRQRGWIK